MLALYISLLDTEEQISKFEHMICCLRQSFCFGILYPN